MTRLLPLLLLLCLGCDANAQDKFIVGREATNGWPFRHISLTNPIPYAISSYSRSGDLQSDAPTNGVVLLAEIHGEVVTNWETTSREQPTLPSWAPATLHQIGTVRSNTIANVNWKGQTIPVVLESVVINTLTRHIQESNIILN